MPAKTNEVADPVTLWRGANRQNPWSPVEFLQAGSMFPNLNAQLNQALYGGVQAQQQMPAWTQRTLPPRLNYQQDMAKYYPAFQPPPPGVPTAPGLNPNYGLGQPTGKRTMANPYPLNGNVPLWASFNQTGSITNATNPFIGLLEMLGGNRK